MKNYRLLLVLLFSLVGWMLHADVFAQTTYTASPSSYTSVPTSDYKYSSSITYHGNLLVAKASISGSSVSFVVKKDNGSTFANQCEVTVKEGSLTGTVINKKTYSAGYSSINHSIGNLSFTSGSKKYYVILCSKGSSDIYYYCNPITITASTTATPSLTLASSLRFKDASGSSVTTLTKDKTYTFTTTVKNTGSGSWSGAFYLKNASGNMLSWSKTIASGGTATLEGSYTPTSTGSATMTLYYQTGGSGTGYEVKSGSYTNGVSYSVTSPLATPSYANFSASDITTTGFTAKWSAVSGATSYNINVKLASASDYSNVVFGKTGITGTSCSVTGLKAGTAYTFQIQAVNSTTKSDWSKSSSSITTKAETATPSLTLASALRFKDSSGSYVTTLTKDKTYTFTTTVKNTGSGSWSGAFYLKNASGDMLSWSKTIASGGTATLEGSYTPTSTGSYSMKLYYQTGGSGTGYEVKPGSYTNGVSYSVTSPLATPSYANFSASDITTTGFTAKWSAVSGATSYNINVKLASASDYSNVVFGKTGITGTSCSVTGLKAGTAYTFQIQAVNSTTKSDWSKSSSSITTKSEANAPSLTLYAPLRFKDSSGSYVTTLTKGKTYTFTTTVKNTGTASWSGAFYLKNASGNMLSWSKTIASGGTALLEDTYTPTATGSYSMTLYYQTGGAGTGYEVKPGSYTNGVSYSVTSENTLETPSYTSFSYSNLSTTGFTAKWSAVSGATSYNINVKLASASDYSNVVFGKTGITGTSCSVTGLKAGTAYTFQIQAVNSTTKSTWSKSSSSITTQAETSYNTAALEMAANMWFEYNGTKVTTLTSGKTYTFHASVENTAKTAWKGDFWLKTADGRNLLSIGSKTLNANIVSALTQTFTPEFNYSGKVYLKCRASGYSGSGSDVGSANYANYMTVTLQGLLDAPNNSTFSASGITQTGFTASWNAVPGATQYNIKVKLASESTYGNLFDGGSSTNSIKVTGLQPGNAYTFQVQAVNSSAKSSWSGSSKSITTLSPQNSLTLAGGPFFDTNVMTLGKSYTANVKVKNTGSTSWTGALYLKDDNAASSADANLLSWSKTIAAGETVTLPGSYTAKRAGTMKVSLYYQTGGTGAGSLVDRGYYSQGQTVTVSSAQTTLKAPDYTQFYGDEITTSSFKAHWPKVDGATQYDVNIVEASKEYLTSQGMLTMGSSTNYLSVTGLKPGTTYKFQVRAKNLKESSEWSKSGSNLVTTKAAATDGDYCEKANLAIYATYGFGTTKLTQGQTYTYKVTVWNKGTSPWTGAIILKDENGKEYIKTGKTIKAGSGVPLECAFTPSEVKSKSLSLYYQTDEHGKGRLVEPGSYSNPLVVSVVAGNTASNSLQMASAISMQKEAKTFDRVQLTAKVVNKGTSSWTGKFAIVSGNSTFDTTDGVVTLAPNAEMTIHGGFSPVKAGTYSWTVSYITSGGNGTAQPVANGSYSNTATIVVTDPEAEEVQADMAKVTLVTKGLAPAEITEKSIVYYHYKITDANGKPLQGVTANFKCAGSSTRTSISTLPSDEIGVAVLSVYGEGEDAIGKPGETITFSCSDLTTRTGKVIKLQNPDTDDTKSKIRINTRWLADMASAKAKLDFGLELNWDTWIAKGKVSGGFPMSISWSTDEQGNLSNGTFEMEVNVGGKAETQYNPNKARIPESLSYKLKDFDEKHGFKAGIKGGYTRKFTTSNPTQFAANVLIALVDSWDTGTDERKDRVMRTISEWLLKHFDEGNVTSSIDYNWYISGNAGYKFLKDWKPEFLKSKKPYLFPNSFTATGFPKLSLTGEASFKHLWIESDIDVANVNKYGTSTSYAVKATGDVKDLIKQLNSSKEWVWRLNSKYAYDKIMSDMTPITGASVEFSVTDKGMYKDRSYGTVDNLSFTTSLNFEINSNSILKNLCPKEWQVDAFGVRYYTSSSRTVSSKGDFARYMDAHASQFSSVMPYLDNSIFIIHPFKAFWSWANGTYKDMPSYTAGVTNPGQYSLGESFIASSSASSGIAVNYAEKVKLFGGKISGAWTVSLDLSANSRTSDSYYSLADKRFYHVVDRPESTILSLSGDILKKATSSIGNFFTNVFADDRDNQMSDIYDEVVQKEELEKKGKSFKATTGTAHSYGSTTGGGGSWVRQRVNRRLVEAKQTDICVLNFDGDDEHGNYDDDTKMYFEHYYPAGSLLGVTDVNDTVFVVSEVAEIYGQTDATDIDCLPRGEMKVSTYIGVDDLIPFGLSEGTELGLYHSRPGSNIWHYVGPAGTAAMTDSLGLYMLGTSIKNDVLAPEIDVDYDEETGLLLVTVSDNIGASSNSLRVYVNDEMHEFVIINPNTFVVELTDEEKNSFLTINASIYDLAGNVGECTRIYNIEKLKVVGDVNSDGVADMEDIRYIKEVYVGKPLDFEKCDFDNDGKITVVDVMILVGIINGTYHEGEIEEPGTEPGDITYEYVDLGLPSGTLWATCNVGAAHPEDFGYYYAWGETQPKESYTAANYKFYANGSNADITKYCWASGHGKEDGKTVLELEDDAAFINCGMNWQMPTLEQFDELRSSRYCTWTWITSNGIEGYRVEGKNGNFIFLPAGGYKTTTMNNENQCYYWFNTATGTNPTKANAGWFDSGRVSTIKSNRFEGMPIRPVFNK